MSQQQPPAGGWYYQHGYQNIGPMNEATFLGLVHQGVIRADTMIWHTGWPQWVTYAHYQQTWRPSPVAATPRESQSAPESDPEPEPAPAPESQKQPVPALVPIPASNPVPAPFPVPVPAPVAAHQPPTYYGTPGQGSSKALEYDASSAYFRMGIFVLVAGMLLATVYAGLAEATAIQLPDWMEAGEGRAQENIDYAAIEQQAQTLNDMGESSQPFAEFTAYSEELRPLARDARTLRTASSYQMMRRFDVAGGSDPLDNTLGAIISAHEIMVKVHRLATELSRAGPRILDASRECRAQGEIQRCEVLLEALTSARGTLVEFTQEGSKLLSYLDDADEMVDNIQSVGVVAGIPGVSSFVSDTRDTIQSGRSKVLDFLCPYADAAQGLYQSAVAMSGDAASPQLRKAIKTAETSDWDKTEQALYVAYEEASPRVQPELDLLTDRLAYRRAVDIGFWVLVALLLLHMIVRISKIKRAGRAFEAYKNQGPMFRTPSKVSGWGVAFFVLSGLAIVAFMVAIPLMRMSAGMDELKTAHNIATTGSRMKQTSGTVSYGTHTHMDTSARLVEAEKLVVTGRQLLDDMDHSPSFWIVGAAYADERDELESMVKDASEYLGGAAGEAGNPLAPCAGRR